MAISYKRGFTLIELLVVVAIIGLLAAIVITSVSGARTKGIDTTTKGQLSNLRTMAETFYGFNNQNTYAGFCAAASTTPALTTVANAYGGLTVNTTFASASAATNVTCHDSATGWAVQAPLKDTSTYQAWCVDSTGASKGEASATSLAASTAVCN